MCTSIETFPLSHLMSHNNVTCDWRIFQPKKHRKRNNFAGQFFLQVQHFFLFLCFCLCYISLLTYIQSEPSRNQRRQFVILLIDKCKWAPRSLSGGPSTAVGSIRKYLTAVCLWASTLILGLELKTPSWRLSGWGRKLKALCFEGRTYRLCFGNGPAWLPVCLHSRSRWYWGVETVELAAEEQSKCLFTLSTGESDRIKRAEVKSSGEIIYLFQKEILQCVRLYFLLNKSLIVVLNGKKKRKKRPGVRAGFYVT